MILILSADKDLTTNEVCDWLIFNKQEYVRFNGETGIDFPNTEVSSQQGQYKIEFKRTKRVIDLEEVSAYWYRRGYLNRTISKVELPERPNLAGEINHFLAKEIKHYKEFLYLFLDDKPGIGSFSNNAKNKLHLLLSAERLGLNIPPTTILTQKKDLLAFQEKHGALIAKAIYNGFSFDAPQFAIEGYTCLLEEETIRNLPDEFFPSFFQKNIPKKLDIRIFYLSGKFYSSAVFSQRDKQTQIDVRRYNDEKPNRVIPFALPQEIEEKIHRLMTQQNLKSGSIDLVYGTDKQFYFLEINPIGQFAQVSYPCNYYLEEIVAQELHQATIKHEGT